MIFLGLYIFMSLVWGGFCFHIQLTIYPDEKTNKVLFGYILNILFTPISMVYAIMQIHKLDIKWKKK